MHGPRDFALTSPSRANSPGSSPKTVGLETKRTVLNSLGSSLPPTHSTSAMPQVVAADRNYRPDSDLIVRTKLDPRDSVRDPILSMSRFQGPTVARRFEAYPPQAHGPASVGLRCGGHDRGGAGMIDSKSLVAGCSPRRAVQALRYCIFPAHHRPGHRHGIGCVSVQDLPVGYHPSVQMRPGLQVSDTTRSGCLTTPSPWSR